MDDRPHNGPLVSIVTPALNEAGNLAALADRIKETLQAVGRYELIVVDDGSTDETREKLRALSVERPEIKYISLSRNFGHQAALTAGLRAASGRCVIAMDADLQHPPSALIEMISFWRAGFDVVLTEREDHEGAPLFKKATSRAFYALLSWLSEAKLAPGSADFFLIDAKALAALRRYDEQHIFYRGLLPNLGFRQHRLKYKAAPRHAGASSYTLKKMLRLARDGVLATSIKPLRLGVFLSALVGVGALFYAAYAVFVSLVLGQALPGWTSVILVMTTIGAMQLFALGVIGEYVGRILVEARGRPLYLVAETNIETLDRDAPASSGAQDRKAMQ